MPKPKPELWKRVPSCWFDFQDVYDEAVETAPYGSILVEVGSFWGQSAIYLAEAARIANKKLCVYAVDKWTLRPNNDPSMFDPSRAADHVEPRIHAQFHNHTFEAFAHFVEESGLSPDPLRILRMDSLEAAVILRHFRSTIHFVYLDGDHEYDHVIQELRMWDPGELRLFAGHDYTEEFHGVVQAVTEYFLPKRRKVDIQGRSWIVRPKPPGGAYGRL